MATTKTRAPKKRKKPAKSDLSEKELMALRETVEQAAAALDAANAEAKVLEDKASTLVRDAKGRYREGVAAYQTACRTAKVPCEFQSRTRRPNVSERTVFEVARTDEGVRVVVKGRPETEEVIPLATLKASVNKAAYAYTDRQLGTREEVGNKGGSLSNRLRRVLEL